MKKSSISLCAIATSALLTGSAFAELTLNPGSAVRNERFYSGADRAFLAQSFNLSGVGNSNFLGQSGSSQWLTMISPSYFITSNHFQSTIGVNPIFRDNSGTNLTDLYDGTVVSYQRIGTTDLLVGKLSVPVPSTVAKYSILPASTSLSGKDLYIVGQGATGEKVGLNGITGSVQTITVTGTIADGTASVFEYNFSTVGGYASDEALLNAGDSGGPTFVAVNGQLALAGEHWVVSDNGTPQNTDDSSFDTYIPAYINAIQTYVQTNSGGTESITVVPEPTSAMLLIAIPAALLRRRR